MRRRRHAAWPPACAWPDCERDRAPGSDVCVKHAVVREERKRRHMRKG